MEEKAKLAQIEKNQKRELHRKMTKQSFETMNKIINQSDGSKKITNTNLINIPAGVSAIKLHNIIIRKVTPNKEMSENEVSKVNDICTLPSAQKLKYTDRSSTQSIDENVELPINEIHSESARGQKMTHYKVSNNITKRISPSDRHPTNTNVKQQNKNPRSKRKRLTLSPEDNDDDFSEIMPAKKDRRSTTTNPLWKKSELTKDAEDTEEAAKRIFTSSLELTPSDPRPFPSPIDNSKNLLSLSGKTEKIFLCNVCQTIFDTRKDLTQHIKTHLTCKFCKKKIKNLPSLHKHLQTTCFPFIIQNPPDLKLTRVDEMSSIVNKYSEAFAELKTSNKESLSQSKRLHEFDEDGTGDTVLADIDPQHILKTENVQYVESTLKMLLCQNDSDDTIINDEDATSTHYSETDEVSASKSALIQTYPKVFKTENVQRVESILMTMTEKNDSDEVVFVDQDSTNKQQCHVNGENEPDQDVVYISDNDDTHSEPLVAFSEAPIEIYIVDTNEQTDPLAITKPEPTVSVSVVRPTVNSISASCVPNILHRDKVIQMLFSKHIIPHSSSEMTDKATDPYVPHNDDIQQLNNFIFFKGLLRDLHHFKTPVYFKHDTKISASYIMEQNPSVAERIQSAVEEVVDITNEEPEVGENTSNSRDLTSASLPATNALLKMSSAATGIPRQLRNALCTTSAQTQSKCPISQKSQGIRSDQTLRFTKLPRVNNPDFQIAVGNRNISQLFNTAQSDAVHQIRNKPQNKTTTSVRIISTHKIIAPKPADTNCQISQESGPDQTQHLNKIFPTNSPDLQIATVGNRTISQTFNAAEQVVNGQELYSLQMNTSGTVSGGPLLTTPQSTVLNQMFTMYPTFPTDQIFTSVSNSLCNQTIGTHQMRDIPQGTNFITGQNTTSTVVCNTSQSAVANLVGNVYNPLNSCQMLATNGTFDVNPTLMGSTSTQSSISMPESTNYFLDTTKTPVSTNEKQVVANNKPPLLWIKDISELSDRPQLQ